MEQTGVCRQCHEKYQPKIKVESHPPDLTERRYIDSNGCWNWTGYVRPNGYGRLTYQKKQYYPHRLSYLLNKGAIPDGQEVCHSCDN